MGQGRRPIRVPVALSCRVLGLTTQGYHKWLKDPVSPRDWDDTHAINALAEIHDERPQARVPVSHR